MHTYTCACPHHIHVPTTHSHTDILMPDMMAHPSNLSSPEVAVGGSVVQSQLHSQFGDSQNYMIAIFKVCFRREMIRTSPTYIARNEAYDKNDKEAVLLAR